MASILDKDRDQVEQWLEEGVSKTRIAKNLKVNRSSLYLWLYSRGIIPYPERKVIKPHPLLEHAERITDDITNQIMNELYRVFSQAMEGLEHKDLWLGNGHHAAQNMQADVMEKLKPLLKAVIHKKVLR